MSMNPWMGISNSILRKHGLGAATGTPQDDVDNVIFSAQGQLEQAWGVLSQAMSAGADTSLIEQHRAQIQLLSQRLKELHENYAGSSQGDKLVEWQKQAQQTVRDVEAETNAVVKLQKQTIEGASYTGLWWGLGALTAVGLVGYWVYKHKK